MTSDTRAEHGFSVDVDDRGVVRLTIDRPQVRNAFDDELVTALTQAARRLGDDAAVRVVVLTGRGAMFSAGADLDAMRASAGRTYDDNVADALTLGAMFRTLWDLPQPVIGRINGSAFGGGAGLVAVCDVAITVPDAMFGFPEVRLGLVPAVVSPYVVRRIGPGPARALFVTGERIDAAHAARVGLVQRVVADSDLDAAVEQVVAACLRGGPAAIAVAKRLPELALGDLDAATATTPSLIADARAGAEGREGVAAFLERRRPSWAEDTGSPGRG